MMKIRQMSYDLTDRDKPKIRHRTIWRPWWWIKRWIRRAKPIENLPPGINGWVKVKKKKPEVSPATEKQEADQ